MPPTVIASDLAHYPLAAVASPAAVVMVRPHHFTVNAETAADNRFQANDAPSAALAAAAYDEITGAAAVLGGHGITVHLFEDEGTATPDAVFPNNWFSTHEDGRIALYPMKAPNRRAERRTDIIDALRAAYTVRDVVDYSPAEAEGRYLEGTGSMVLDHAARVAYAVAAERTHPQLFARFCADFGYEPFLFDAADADGVAIYHTNVLMCVGARFALVGLEMISDPARRAALVARLEATGKTVIALTSAQIGQFAGNALELAGRDGPILALSQTAYNALMPAQIAAISTHATPVPLAIPTIEKAGGSVRCTLAGIHLPPR